MQNSKIIANIKEAIAQHDAGQISDGALMAKISVMSKNYAGQHRAVVNTQRPEVRMGMSKKTTRPTQAARAAH